MPEPGIEQVGRAAAQAALDKKAEDPVLLDMRGLSSFTDLFLVCSANSEPHLKAVVGGIEESLRENFGRRPRKVDGYPVSQWMVMDYGDLVVHVFQEDRRTFYGLEDLWSDAPRIAP